MVMKRKIGSCMLLLVAAMLVFTGRAGAQDTVWNGNADTDFFNDGNWSAGAPDTATAYGIIDSTDANHVAIIDASTGSVTLDGVDLGFFDGGGNVIQNGGTLNFDTFTETKIGGDGPLPSSWIMNGDSVILYDAPLSGAGSGYGLDNNGSDFDVGNGASVATLELHDNAILRISDDMKISDNGVAAGGNVLLDGNAQITAGSGTSMGSDGPATLTIADNALYVSGNSAGPGNSAEGYTDEGYLAFSEGEVVVKDNGRFWLRTLQARGNVDKPTSIMVQDSGSFEIFDVFNHASPVLGTTTVVGSVSGNERTSEVAEGVGSSMTITVKNTGTMTVDSDIADSAWSGLALSGGNNTGGNNGGGSTLVDVQDQGTFIVQQDLNMTLGFDIDATSTLKVTGPNATVAVNGNLRMALDEFDAQNPGTAALHAVITALTHSTITVGGNVNIDNGDLIVELDGYTPTGGEEYTLINALGVTGAAFENEDFTLAPLAAGLSWEVAVSPTSVLLKVLGGPDKGDFDGSGMVGNGDLTLLLDGWGGAPGAAWVNDVPASVGNDSLTILLDNWGNDYTGGLAAVTVPEPASLAIALLAAISGLAMGRRA